MRNLCLCLALLVPLTASATDEDFQRFYNAALRLHEGLEYERALEQLALARKQASTGDQASLVSLAEGVVLADLNRNDEAQAAFKNGLLLSPDAKLPLKVSPRVAGEVEALRVKVKKELAPLLAKQEADRLKAETEAKALAQARIDAEAKKAEAEAKAREAQRLEVDKRNAEAETKSKEAVKLLAEAEAKLKEISKLEEERRQALLVSRDAPKKVVILPEETPIIVQPPLIPSSPPSKAPMVMTFVFLGLGAAAAGIGGYFGAQSQTQVQTAKDAAFQDEANRALRSADGSALTANVLFAGAGAMGLGALISGIAWGTQSAPPAPAEGSAR